MYTDAANKATKKYKKNNIKRISFEIQKDYFENILKPAADRAGIGVNTLIKQAIKEYLEKDQR